MDRWTQKQLRQNMKMMNELKEKRPPPVTPPPAERVANAPVEAGRMASVVAA